MSQAGGVLGSQVLAAACSADELLGCAATSAVWQCGDDEIEATLEHLDRVDARSAALRSTLLAEAEQRGLRERTGAPSTERWAADRFRWSRPQANRVLAAARAHARQPAVHAALATGEVTVEQAAVIAAGLDRVDAVPGVSDGQRTEAAQVLVEQARCLDPRQLELTAIVIAEKLTRLPSADDPGDAAAIERERKRAEREAQQRETNRFRLGRRNGRTRGIIDFGTLGEAVAVEWARLAVKPSPGVDGFEDTRDKPERLGDAMVDLLAAAAARTDGPCCSDQDHHDDRAGDPAGPRLFDEPDGDELDGDEQTGARAGGLDAAQQPCCGHRGPISPIALLTVTVTLEGLRAGLPGAGVLDTGRTVSAATLRQLACDCLVIPAVMGGRSEVLDLGRSRRLFTLAQKRATALHQLACAAPGCDRPPAACQVHHDWEWSNGGPTDLDSGTLLCGYHHRMVHRQGWKVRRAANGYPEFIPPTSIDPQQRPRQHIRYQLLAGQRLRT